MRRVGNSKTDVRGLESRAESLLELLEGIPAHRASRKMRTRADGANSGREKEEGGRGRRARGERV
jgi:hypothetical protein